MTIAFWRILHTRSPAATLLANYVCFASYPHPQRVSLQAWLWKGWWMSGSWLIIKGGRWLIRTMCVFLYSVNKIYHSCDAGSGSESDLWRVKMHGEPKAEALSETQPWQCPTPPREHGSEISHSCSGNRSLFPLSQFLPCWIYLSQTFGSFQDCSEVIQNLWYKMRCREHQNFREKHNCISVFLSWVTVPFECGNSNITLICML